MRALLITSLVLSVLAISGFLCIQPNYANALPVSYNQALPTINWNIHPRSTHEVFVSSTNTNVIDQWFSASTNDYVLWYRGGIQPSTLATGPVLIDNIQSKQVSTSTNATQFLTMNPGSFTNRTLVVTIGFCQCTGNDTNTNHRISSITFQGNALTKAINKTLPFTSSVYSSEIWYLVNPPSSSGSIIVTPVLSTHSYTMEIGAYALYNVLTTSPLGSTGSGSSGGSPITANITPATARGFVIDDIEARAGTLTPNSDVQGWKQEIGGSTAGGSQYRPSPLIGSTNTLSWTNAGPQGAVLSVVEIKPASVHFNGLYLSGPLTSKTNNFIANGSKIYYTTQIIGDNTKFKVDHINSLTGIITHDFSVNTSCVPTLISLFLTTHDVLEWCSATNDHYLSTSSTNSSSFNAGSFFISNQKIGATSNVIRANFNNTTPQALNTNKCELLYVPTNTTIKVNDLGCDISLPPKPVKYFNGFGFTMANNYYINSTIPFYSSIISNTNIHYLTLPTQVTGIADPSVYFVLQNSTDSYITSVTATNIYYISKTALNNIFITGKYAMQSYFTLYTNSTGTDTPPHDLINTLSWKIYSLSTNQTVSRYGVITLPSSHTMKGASSESSIRTVDPRWTNDGQVYPYLISSGSLFPIFLTVLNAPVDSGLILSDSSQVVNNLNSVWCITQLDGTRSAECDLPPNKCATVYVGDISLAPVIYNYEGLVCATGVNQKTISYTNTLPLTFYTLRYGATHTYDPNTNALSVTVRSSVAPYTYNVLIKNSTGVTAQNYTTTINGTIDTHNFNVSAVTKPASVFVTIPSVGQIYQAYVGSPFSFASTISFFHQYLSYQGFDLLSFIPLIFAAMFTRNTVGIGTALVVVVIATLSFLSVVVVSDTVVIVSMIVAVLGLIGYRGLYG